MATRAISASRVFSEPLESATVILTPWSFASVLVVL